MPDSDMEISLTLPDLVTVSNALLGFLSITYVVDGRFFSASLLIVICVGLDGLDGFLARRLDVEHDMGAYLDFFSDMISFCFAPAVLLYSTFYEIQLGRAWQSPQNALATIVPFLIVFFGTMRLTRFADKTFTQKIYNGLPAPCLALLVVHLTYLLGWRSTGWNHPNLTLLVILGFSLLLYSPIRYPKLRGAKLKMGAAVFIALTLTGILLIFFARNEAKVFLLFTLVGLMGYVFLGPLMVVDNDERKRGDDRKDGDGR